MDGCILDYFVAGNDRFHALIYTIIKQYQDSLRRSSVPERMQLTQTISTGDEPQAVDASATSGVENY